MTDQFSYLLPYPASVLCRTLIPNLNFLVSCSFFLLYQLLLVNSRRSSLIIKQRECPFNPTFSWMFT